MGWSIKVITVRGIPIRVHASFLLILAWAAYAGLTGFSGVGGAGWLRGAAFMMVFVMLLFICVVLHELGHSLVAQLFGVKVHDITLWPVGGVARLARMPQRPYQEFLITAAGPATNVFLALALATVAALWIGPRQLAGVLLSPRQQAGLVEALNGQTLVLLLTVQNVLLVLFNLIPAFPMDGGRLLRSLLAAFIPFRSATRIASMVGQGLAVVLVFASVVPPGNLFLTLAGVFVFVSAWQERSNVVMTDNLRGVTVRAAMRPLGARLSPQQTLGDVTATVAASPQAAYPVVEGGKLRGIVTREQALAYARKASPGATLSAHFTPGFGQLGPDDSLLVAQERLQEQPAFAVVEDGRAVGIITRGDVARLAETLQAYAGAVPRE